METENHSQTSDWVNAKILRDRVSISLVHVGLIDESTLDQRNLVSRNTIELKETLLIWWQCRIRLTPREIGHTVGTVWMGIFWKMKIKTSFFLKKKIPARWDSLLWKGPVLVTCTGLVWMRRSRQAKLLMHLYKINRPSGTLGLWNSKRIWKAMGKWLLGIANKFLGILWAHYSTYKTSGTYVPVWIRTSYPNLRKILQITSRDISENIAWLSRKIIH